MDNQTKKTELQKLQDEYPELDYADGFFYPSPDCDDYITENASNADPVNADLLIEDHILWFESLANTGISAKKFIEDKYNNDYELAFKSI